MLFPEMDRLADVPEITTARWGPWNVSPDAMMCATSRMVVKRGAGGDRGALQPCCLTTNASTWVREHWKQAAAGRTLNHPDCARFCVLGGGSCSVG